MNTVADPGFPVGGVDLVGPLYVKTKELGPLGGRAPSAPLDPSMEHLWC